MTTCKTLPVAAQATTSSMKDRKILAGLGFVRPANHFAGRDFKGCKERGGAVTLVGALVALHHLLASRNKTRWPHDGLDRRLFIHTEHDGVFRWRQVQRHHVCRLGGKVGVPADTPRTPARQTDAFDAQNFPDPPRGHPQRGSQPRERPSGQILLVAPAPVGPGCVRAVQGRAWRGAPERGRSCRPATPAVKKRHRHRQTVSLSSPISFAVSLTPTPSMPRSTMRARSLSRA